MVQAIRPVVSVTSGRSISPVLPVIFAWRRISSALPLTRGAAFGALVLLYRQSGRNAEMEEIDELLRDENIL